MLRSAQPDELSLVKLSIFNLRRFDLFVLLLFIVAVMASKDYKLIVETQCSIHDDFIFVLKLTSLAHLCCVTVIFLTFTACANNSC